MADRIKDAEDERLEQLFAAETIADDGFTARVTSRLRRRAWTRRLVLGGAVVLGSSIAFGPIVELVSLASSALFDPVSGLLDVSADWASSPQTMIAGGLLFGLLMFGLGFLED